MGAVTKVRNRVGRRRGWIRPTLASASTPGHPTLSPSQRFVKGSDCGWPRPTQGRGTGLLVTPTPGNRPRAAASVVAPRSRGSFVLPEIHLCKLQTTDAQLANRAADTCKSGGYTFSRRSHQNRLCPCNQGAGPIRVCAAGIHPPAADAGPVGRRRETATGGGGSGWDRAPVASPAGPDLPVGQGPQNHPIG